MQQVYTGRDEMDANFLKGLLVEEGIGAIVQGEALQETWGDLNLTAKSLPSVWVPDEDVPRAAPIVEEYRRRDAADAVTGEPPARADLGLCQLRREVRGAVHPLLALRPRPAGGEHGDGAGIITPPFARGRSHPLELLLFGVGVCWWVIGLAIHARYGGRLRSVLPFVVNIGASLWVLAGILTCFGRW